MMYVKIHNWKKKCLCLHLQHGYYMYILSCALHVTMERYINIYIDNMDTKSECVNIHIYRNKFLDKEE